MSRSLVHPFRLIAAGLFAPVLAAAGFVTAAHANDSTAELGTGGIMLTRSDAVRLVSEDLYLSMDEVRVDYVFENRKDEAVETIVAFPMPDLRGGIDNNIALPGDTADNFLEFTTEIDGNPVKPQLDQRAVVAGIDMTEIVKGPGVPLFPFGEATGEAIKALPDPVKADWVTSGLLQKMEFNAGKGWETAYFANWTLRSAYWWRATFPAKSSVSVSHRYKPSVGASAGVYLVRDGKPNEYFADYQSKYCIDDDFLAGLIKADNEDRMLTEYRLDYVLTSGGNWANGTIGKFRLTVDKGSPDNMVSFCGEGVTKTGPTTFEMSAENFYPEKDIRVLIVGPPDL